MDSSVQEEVDRLIRQNYRVTDDLNELLGGILRAALEQTRCVECGVTVRGRGSIDLSRQSAEIQCQSLLAVGAGESFAADRAGGARGYGAGDRGDSIEIAHGGRAVGSIRWTPGEDSPEGERLAELFVLLARELAFLIQRYEVSARARAELGQDLRLVGTSRPLRRLEEQIERSCRVELPVLLEGEFGVEKLPVAYAIHACSRRREAPFVEVRCEAQSPAAAEDELAEWFAAADGGTVFFNGIDQLDPELQSRLSAYISSGVGQWVNSNAGRGPAEVRVVASCDRDLRQMVDAGEFSRSLLAELGFVKLRVPPLRERSGDVRPIVERLLAKYDPGRSRNLSEACLGVLEAHDWPENLFEIERLIARAVAMTDEEVIGLETFRALSPRVARADAAGSDEAPAASDDDASREDDASRDNGEGDEVTVEQLTKLVATGDFSFSRNYHPSLRKALRYIGENSEEPLSLSELASEACVSGSHLSYLFRTTLGTTFKPLLARVRIEHAKTLLVERADLRITDVSLDVGFGDLSHFEKTFKRFVKLNPREYRRRKLEELGGQGAARA